MANRYEEIQKELTCIKIELVRYNSMLEEHMRRTHLNEVQLEKLDNKVAKKADRAYITWTLGITMAIVTIAVYLARMYPV
jgi:hypothetical protein